MEESPLHIVAELALELAMILIAAKIGGEICERYFKVPAVLGELAAGVLISPFALGGIHWFGGGALFPIPVDAAPGVPVKPELFFVAQVAAIILLFEAGLETDRRQFLKYAGPASVVAVGGVIFSFVLGFYATIAFGFASTDSTQDMLPALFVGAVMTATSVGITARVLADLRRIDSPEGVTILGAAVVDDVLGIIVLAIVVGIGQEGEVTLSSLAIILVKAVGFWLGLMLLGSLVSNHISRALLWFRSSGAWVAVAIALAFIAAAVAELYFGLAMIIGSYTLGLALSGTQLKERIQEPMHQINWFLVPVFFCVIGMQADFSAFASAEHEFSLFTVVAFSLVLIFLGIISKVGGAGLPALLVGFNKKGAWRIGVGMLPRGEVALIVAGIGLSSGVVSQLEFGVSIVMTVATTVLAPIILVPAFHGGSGLRHPVATNDAVEIEGAQATSGAVGDE